MKIFKDLKESLQKHFLESLKWASVQMMAFWAVIWTIYSQLPPESMTWLAQWHVPAFMGIGQATMTYLARMHPQGGSA